MINRAQYVAFSIYLVSLVAACACAGGEKTIIAPPPVGSSDFTINVRVEDAESA